VATIHVRKRPHVHFELARVVRLVGEPAAVGRDDPVLFGERCLHERRHAMGSVQLDLHHIVASLRGCFREDQARAVWRHGPGKVPVGALGQPLDRAGAIGRLPVEIPPARSELKTSRRPSGVNAG